MLSKRGSRRTSMIKRLTICFLITVVASVATVAQIQSKAQVMFLGVYHFANPNLDVVKSNFPDHLSEKKQQEIGEVLDLLAKFNPTKIVVEAPPEQTSVQTNYQAYLKGEYKLRANEIEQIGYRLAQRLGHKQVYPADHRLDFDFNSILAAARETNNKYFLETVPKVLAEVEAMQKRQAQMTVRDAL